MRPCTAGDPHPNLKRGMEEEHCEMYGHNVPFTTKNYGITTTPEKEYKIITGEIQCPEEDKMDRDGKIVRAIKTIEDLQELQHAKDCNL